jgi:prophage antirepressor-like protein
MSDNFNLELAIPEQVCPGGMIIRMAGTPDEPLFCLADVCLVLDNANPSQVAARLDAEDKALHIVEVNGQASSQMQFVTEPALYDVVLTSRAENARPLKRWVTHDVLPSIRRHGRYPPPAEAVQP